MGPTLRRWHGTWSGMRARNPEPTLVLPDGAMQPVGYIVMRHSVQAGRPARAFSRWIARIPADYRHFVLAAPDGAPSDVDADPNRIAVLKDYRSLMPLAQEARKPMFLLRPADGAFGGHQRAVQECSDDFWQLTKSIRVRCGLAPAEATPPGADVATAPGLPDV